MSTRTLAWVALALWVVTVAAGAFLFLRGYTVPSRDERTAIALAPAERERVLGQMRGMLETVRGVVDGLAAEDPARVAGAARGGGRAAQRMSPALMAKLPRPFMQLGMSVHAGFDGLADAAQAGAPPPELMGRLKGILDTCVGCHAAYRFAPPEAP